MFLEALTRDLQKTQRAIASSCLFCVPQARSLVADQELTADDLYNHFLTPAGTATDAHARRPGEYDTLNGKTVSIQGSHIHTGRGFDEKRKVRILLSEQKEVHHQEVTVLHLSRPLSGGIALPEDPNELDVATFRRFTAILRSFPENELVFYQLDETIAQVKKICKHNQFFNRYEQTLPSLLQEEWEIAVDEILQAGSFEDDSESDGEKSEYGNHQLQSHSSHLLQIQQVVECYLMEQLHDFIFPRVVISCRAQEQTLSQVLYRMRHYSPDDFGIRKEFQCFVQDAVDTLVGVKDRKTPLDMLLAFKSCIDSINDAITRNLKQHNLDLGRYQMTTDDILDQLLFVLVQAFSHTALVGSSSEGGSDGEEERSDEDDSTMQRRQSLSSSSRDQDGAEEKGTDEYSDSQNAAASRFPITAVLKYISDYHFINSNTTALGFTIANFQVAIEYFLMRAAHIETCRVCIQSLQVERGGDDGGSEAMALSTCSQGILLSKCEAAYERNVRGLHTVSSELNDHLRSTARDDDSDREEDEGDGGFKQLFIVGDWSSASSPSEKEESEEDDDDYVNVTPDDDFQAHGGHFLSAEANTAVRVNRVATSTLTKTSSSGTTATITQISAGQRFFAAVNDQGQLFTWGDRSGGRLGYASAAGDARRQQIPRRVVAGVFEKCHVINVACGAFHALATDVNGHVFAWGSNVRGQLGFLTHTTISESSATATTVVAAPTLVTDLRGTYVSSVACGEYHSLALLSDGRVFSWGCNKYSKLGRVTESFADAVQPKALNETWTGFALDLKTVHSGEEARNGDSLKKTKSNSVVRRIAAGKDHSLAISYDGAVFAWGRGDSGQLGHGSFMDVARPKQVMALSRSQMETPSGFSVVDIAGGSDFSLFLTSTGVAFVSGRDPSSSGFNSQPTLFPELIQHNSSQPVIGISCGEAHFGLHLSNGMLLVSNSGNESNRVDGERAEDDDLSNHHERDVKQRQLELVGSIRHIKRVACGGSHTREAPVPCFHRGARQHPHRALRFAVDRVLAVRVRRGAHGTRAIAPTAAAAAAAKRQTAHLEARRLEQVAPLAGHAQLPREEAREAEHRDTRARPDAGVELDPRDDRQVEEEERDAQQHELVRLHLLALTLLEPPGRERRVPLHVRDVHLLDVLLERVARVPRDREQQRRAHDRGREQRDAHDRRRHGVHEQQRLADVLRQPQVRHRRDREATEQRALLRDRGELVRARLANQVLILDALLAQEPLDVGVAPLVRAHGVVVEPLHLLVAVCHILVAPMLGHAQVVRPEERVHDARRHA